MELQKNGKYKLKTPLKRNPLRRTPTGWVRSRNDYFRAVRHVLGGGQERRQEGVVECGNC